MEQATRATYRGQVTKLVNSAQEYLQSDAARFSEKTENLDSVQEELTVFLDRLTSAHENLLKANQDVRPFIKLEDAEKETDSIADYSDKAIATITRLKQRLNKVRQYSSFNISTRVNTNSHQPNEQVSGVKLKKLHPKMFAGDFNDWIPFWEQFRTLIHEDKSLSTIDKFNYLQSLLTGKAATTIAGLTPTESCYDAAISLLKEEYGDTEKIVDHHMQRLLSIQPVTSKADAVSLRRLYNSVLVCTRSLSVVGIPVSNYFVMLKGVLLRCLPTEMRVEFYRRCDSSSACLQQDLSSQKGDLNSDENNDVSSAASTVSSIDFNVDNQVKRLLKFLKIEVESLEKAYDAKPPTNRPQLNSSAQIEKTAIGLFTTLTTENECFFCKSSTHGTKECSDSVKKLAEKKDMLKSDGRCFRCCKRGHNSKNCRNRFLLCRNCKGRHATSMCDPHYKQQRLNSFEQNKESDAVSTCAAQQTINLYTTYAAKRLSSVYLQTACSFVYGSQACNSFYIRLVLDGGSQLTFIRSNVARRLKLPIIGTHSLTVIPFGSKGKLTPQLCNKVRLSLRSQHNGRVVELEALEVPEICIDVLPFPNSNEISFSLALADSPLPDYKLEDGISLLVGADKYWKLVTGEFKRLNEDLTAINTILGWTLQGSSPISMNVESNLSTALHVCACENIQNFWRLEAIGIEGENYKAVSGKLSNYIERVGDRFEAKLIWKPVRTNTPLNNNYAGAVCRLKSLVRKLSANSKLMYREDKVTTKLRIVFDASSHASGQLSLNDHLEKGENLLPDVLAMLLNFRSGRIGLVADIEKAFLQILLCNDDKDSHRLLWFSERIKNNQALPPVQEYRMTRVTFGVNCSPFLLGATIRLILEEAMGRYPETSTALMNSFYMDALVISTDERETAKRLHLEATSILKGASMNLRQWNTNDIHIRQQFDNNEEVPNVQKILGLRWYVITDELAVDVDTVARLLESPLIGTKRNVLKVMASFYDPLGVLGPWIVRLKILFQLLWRKELNWDEALPDELMTIWNAICNELDDLRELTIPRQVCAENELPEAQLHVFADASLSAYGVVAYLRIFKDNAYRVQFLCSKNRVAPLKENKHPELSLPKLELTAALLASRLITYLKRSLKAFPKKVWLWTDSKITLWWILGDVKKNWMLYVANRVNEIRGHSNLADWRHCPGSENPADLVTRGIKAKILSSSTFWLSGPTWLSEGEENWPVLESNDRHTVLSTSLISMAGDLLQPDLTIAQPKDQIEPPVCPLNFSSWTRLLRVTAYLMRIIDFRLKIPRAPFLQAKELKRAEKFWIHYMQKTNYQPEIAALLRSKDLPSNSKILSLNPFLHDELLRVGGRLQYSTHYDLEPHPIILAKSTHITNLIIKDIHERTLHGGVSQVLFRLRQRYWVPQARQLVRKLCSACTVCKKIKAKPASQPFAPLPRDRLNLVRAFDVTGVDFAGPLYTKGNPKNSGDRCKCYIMLFTCAAIRAIHLELTPDLTSESCLLGLRRFIARRGAPSIIYSDNAKTFKRAALELRKLEKFINAEDLQGFISQHGITWKFIVERAPWWGGFWERMVRSVKGSLKTVIGRSTLDYDQLQTVITEVENVINSRPLTYIGDDPKDLLPLTPANFLQGTQPAILSITTGKENNVSADRIRQIWKDRLRLLGSFKKRFFNEYLQHLRHVHHNKGKGASNIKVGDVVLLHDPATPRQFWKLALIEEIYPGRDGKVRSCQIRLANGSKFKRAVQLLYPLEIN